MLISPLGGGREGVEIVIPSRNKVVKPHNEPAAVYCYLGFTIFGILLVFWIFLVFYILHVLWVYWLTQFYWFSCPTGLAGIKFITFPGSIAPY